MAGLGEPDGVGILQNAVANHARIDIINVMTFDYFDDAQHEMGNDTITAANAVIHQLRGMYPHASTAQLWHMLGITEMVGIDDFGPLEVFTTSDERMVERWATRRGIAELSFRERGNGDCVGTAGSGSCFGIAPGTWAFSHVFEHFTKG